MEIVRQSPYLDFMHRTQLSKLARLVLLALVVLLGLCAAPAYAQTGNRGDLTDRLDAAGGRQFVPLERQRFYAAPTEGILGRWFPNIHGGEAVQLAYTYTGGAFNTSGGLQSGNSYIGVATMAITSDTDKLGLWKNGTFFVNSLFAHGDSPSRWVGDRQGVAAFDYGTPAQVAEYWYEHKFGDRGFVKAGKIDAGGDFFYLDTTADFVHASFSCIPTTRIPAAPDTAWGVAGLWHLTDQLCLNAGIFDGQGNADKFWMSETGKVYGAYQLEYHYSLFRRLPGLVFIGGWNDNCDYPMQSDEQTGNGGISLGMEQALFCQRGGCGTSRELYVFANYGNARADRSEITDYWSAGLLRRGIGSRSDDSLGMAVNYAYLSPQLATQHSYESAFEVYYKCQLTPNCALQPDLQYVAHPGGEERHALVTGLVFQLVF